MAGLYWNAVAPTLRAVLADIMTEPLFDPFRLVGGTALALQLGHRISVDIDLFIDVPYGSIDFNDIDTYFRQRYPYVSKPVAGPVAFGLSYLVGEDPQHAVKIDIYYRSVHPRTFPGRQRPNGLNRGDHSYEDQRNWPEWSEKGFLRYP